MRSFEVSRPTLRTLSRRSFLNWAGVALSVHLAAGDIFSQTVRKGGSGLALSDPRDLPARDARLALRDLNTPHIPPRFSSREAWVERARHLREQVLAAAGLFPMPERTPLRAQVFDRVEQDGFSVEKAYFESYPGFYCTGNLYRPRGDAHQPPYPGIVSPHGHWAYGRLENAPDDLNGGSIPQRCMNLALQGYVAFAYDMVGYNDSFQVPHDFGRDPKAPWGLSRQGLRLHLWGVSLLGLQLWNSIRAVDFLASLPDVDPERIGATGASGGGTQTFLLTAVDERIRAAAPVNMISHFMQGGCICENAPNLRIDTDNVEIAALTAPRPLLMVSAMGDWTRDTERIEYPAVHSIYELLGAADHVEEEQFPYQHNYDRFSREAVYTFFAHRLKNESVDHVAERGEFHVDPGRLLDFSRRATPPEAVSADQLAAYLVKSARGKLESAWPRDREGLDGYRKLFGPVYRAALLAEAPPANDLRWWQTGEARGGRQEIVIQRHSLGDRVPGVLLGASGRSARAVLLVHPEGSAAAAESALAQELLRRHFAVLAIDAFQTGAARDAKRETKVEFFTTYNRTDDMQRVQDILTAAVFLEAVLQPKEMALVGEGMAGLWCLLARPLLPKLISTAADAAGFENESDEAYLDMLYIPLLRRAGDFASAAFLGPAAPLAIHNAGGKFKTEAFRDSFQLQDAAGELRVSDTALTAKEIAAWLAT
jgi:dienelactone hydrolase